MAPRTRTRIARSLALATAGAWLSVGALSAATPAVIEQAGIAFRPKAVTIKAGEHVLFLNSDVFGHNVYSDTEGGAFDIGLQNSGSEVAVTFENPGRFILRCRIHPKMRATVTVTE
ncbi:plastocyanin/azurin family copper-binding protein [Nisaea acidiphila]|uniref:Plastocyanin/azurin family copper-binding protein n=1 Tax=Nisaea acidiphila TaxID=1862145 RepID=A0A9J7B0L0_9PROT|nr:plastocyanin/azurin family copper-binding protein [Nisaea acidiphila]UUX51221.1 plastocyanin/azurin family copper-binding protein [Nisaea acidiphila]